jgi:hypothetical protein
MINLKGGDVPQPTEMARRGDWGHQHLHGRWRVRRAGSGPGVRSWSCRFSGGDGEGVVAEAGDEVESAEGLHVTGDGVDGGQFAGLDLGCPPGGDTYRVGELGPGEPSLLVLPGQPEAALTGHPRRAAPLGLLCAACALDVGGAVPADVPGYRLASVGEVVMAAAGAGLSATAASSAAAASRSSANRRRDGSSRMATSAPRPNSDAETANATL